MKVKTKKYQLEPSKYIGVATKTLLRSELKWSFIPAVLLALGFVFSDYFWWFFTFTLLVPGIYLLFWWIQFAGFTQHEASKMFFTKMNYEIDSRHVLLVLGPRHQSPVDWKTFKKAYKLKNAYVLYMNKANFIYLPFNIFRTENDIKLLETILKRKNLMK